MKCRRMAWNREFLWEDESNRFADGNGQPRERNAGGMQKSCLILELCTATHSYASNPAMIRVNGKRSTTEIGEIKSSAARVILYPKSQDETSVPAAIFLRARAGMLPVCFEHTGIGEPSGPKRNILPQRKVCEAVQTIGGRPEEGCADRMSSLAVPIHRNSVRRLCRHALSIPVGKLLSSQAVDWSPRDDRDRECTSKALG